MAFTLTIIVSVFLCVLAVLVYLRGKKEYTNIVLALAIIFGALWLSSAFAEKIFANPSDSWTLFTFRWANAAGVLALLLLFLVIQALYLGRTPRKWFLVVACLIAVSLPPLCFSKYVISGAHYSSGSLTATSGSLDWLVLALVIISCGGGIYLEVAKWRKSSGIDRARAGIILLGLAIFLPADVIGNYIVPAFSGNYIYSNYTFLAGIILLALTAYAIIRLRLLDVRIILRKTGLFLASLFVLAIPVALLLIPLSSAAISSMAMKAVLFGLFLLLLAVAPFLWRWMERHLSRLFFSGLYDAAELKAEADSIFSSSTDLSDTIPATLRHLIRSLALNSLDIFISQGVLAGYSILYKTSQTEQGIASTIEKATGNTENIVKTEATIITEELQRWPCNKEEEKLASELSLKGIHGCVPLKVMDQVLGYFLLGPKIKKRAFSITDIKCLEDIGAHIALYVDNYRLSSQLKTRLEELEGVYEQLQLADEFKTEIINLTSHELRTPLTILGSFTEILLTQYPRSTETQRFQYLEYIKEACQRLSMIIGQFLTVSNLQRGVSRLEHEEVLVDDLFSRLKASFSKEASNRIKARIMPPGIQISSDSFYLFMMLKNLIENALRFSDEEKPIMLEAIASQDSVKICVLNFGDGIKAEEAEFIFQPFTRLEDLDRHHAGIGLGLYSVRLIADLLKTEIGVTAAPDEGTKFSFDLPILR